MARRVNYGFEKFQKEAKRKKKQAEKLEKKRLKKESATNPDGSVPAADAVPAEEPASTTSDNTTNS
jgi:hypothetical protein